MALGDPVLRANRLPNISDIALEVCPRERWLTRLQELTSNPGDGQQVVLTHLASDVAKGFLRSVVATFNDADGTLAIRNANRFAPGIVESFLGLQKYGVANHLVSGMAYSQIQQLLEGVSPQFEMTVIYEKGGFKLSRKESGGEYQKNFLLANADIVEAIGELKQKFYRFFASDMASQHNVLIVPAGDGSHETILSFDVLLPGSPIDLDVLKSHGHRSHLKVKDVHLIAEIEKKARMFIERHGGPILQKGHLVNLGNSNLEFTATNVGKAAAIIGTGQIARGSVLCLGDSQNDAEMFDLARSNPKLRGCLVWNQDSPQELFSMVDFATPGEASAGNIFNLMLQLRA